MRTTIETAVYYLGDEPFARISTNEQRWKNWIRKMAAKKPDEVRIQSESDGCIVAQLPKNYLRLSPPASRSMSEEQKQKAAERLAAFRAKKGVRFYVEE